MVKFIDAKTKLPVADVQVYSATGLLLSISNQKGQVLFPKKHVFPFTCYHSLYQIGQILSENDSMIHLSPYTREFVEIKVGATTNQQLMRKVLQKSGKQLDESIYYGKARYIHTTLTLLPQITAFENGSLDSITHNVEVDFYFTWQVSKKKKKAKLTIYPFNGKHQAWSRWYYEMGKLSEEGLPPHPFIFDQERLFDFLFVKPERMFPNKKRRSLKSIGDSISVLTFEETGLEDSTEYRKIKAIYTSPDSVLQHFELQNRYFNAKRDSADEVYQITYAYYDNLYFMKTGRFEYKNKRSEFQYLQILELSHTPPPGFEGYKAIDLNKYLYTLKTDFLPVRPLVLPIVK